ncbi:signal peptide protein [Rhodopirellula europaea 6C]|uniref:Signal peptide protein n=1 Tax=Rhodopirellula europaea 6C TaxID=1263867 RepID=M2APB8_9BACT|nr:signal peptide protein [Rhodopirellula europaea 6C]
MKIFRYLICCLLLSSFGFAAGCSSNENRVVEPTPKEKRDADEAKGPMSAAKV